MRVGEHVEQSKNREQGRLESPIERQELSGDLLRTLRPSSPASIWKYALRRSITGRYGVAFPYDTELASSLSHPSVRCEWVNSRTRRDFPRRARPRAPPPGRGRRGSSRAWRRWSSSPSRPDETCQTSGRRRLEVASAPARHPLPRTPPPGRRGPRCDRPERPDLHVALGGAQVSAVIRMDPGMAVCSSARRGGWFVRRL